MTINERMTALGIPGRPYTIADMLDWAAAELDRLEAQLNFSNATITELRDQLEKMAVERDSLQQQLATAQEREVAYRNALMDAAKDFDQAGMGNCCQRVLDELNRIINAAEADHAESV